MTRQINSWAAWILVGIQFMTANFDPEVLQWPGGSLIASFLWLYVTVRSFWSVGTPAVSAFQAARESM
jgi:hypothetical protein